MTQASLLAAAPSLFKSDLLGIVRDPALVAVVAMAIAPMGVFFWFTPQIDAFFANTVGLEGFVRLISGFAVCLPGLFIGWIFGMRFLEDRDCNLELALLATPLGLVRLAGLRMFVALLAAASVAAATALVLEAPALPAAIIGACGGLQALTVAAILPVIAANRVEGLAYSKVLSVFALFAFAALLASPARLLVAPVPTFHMGELLIHGASPGGALIALGVNLVWAFAAFALFRRRALKLT